MKETGEPVRNDAGIGYTMLFEAADLHRGCERLVGHQALPLLLHRSRTRAIATRIKRRTWRPLVLRR